MPVLTPGLGTDGNHSCGLRSITAADEDSAATYFVVDGPLWSANQSGCWTVSLLGVVDHSAFHAAGDGHDLAGDVA